MFAYFFFDDKIEDRKTPAAMLRSIIWQLLLQKEELFQHIELHFDRQNNSLASNKLFEDFWILWEILINILQDKRTGEIFILVDAVDECEQSTREDLFIQLRELFDDDLMQGVKFLVTYRPGISDIEYGLCDIGAHLVLEESNEVNVDLSRYIGVKTDDLARRKKYSDSLKKEVKNALGNQARGTSLWASLMLSELRYVPKHHVSNKLKDLPKGLDQTYAMILNRISEKEDAQFLWFTLLAAKRPLKRKEIVAAYALHRNGTLMEAQSPHDYRDICSSCSSIVYIAKKDNVEDTFFL